MINIETDKRFHEKIATYKISATTRSFSRGFIIPLITLTLVACFALKSK